MNKSGIFVKNLSGEAEYKSFRPTPLKKLIPFTLDDETHTLLNKANKELGIFLSMVDYDVFLASFLRKEALLSSQIEGIQATLEDIFDEGNNVEVINYFNAMNHAIELLKTLPISNRFIKDIHKILMTNDQGSDILPGEFRSSQNWIGASNSNIKTAMYIPPNVKDMKEAMNDLEMFIHEDYVDFDSLIKIALIHYQFETIHPFLDGNGRIGRMLISLLLVSYDCMKYPIFCMSLYFKTNQYEYYQQLNDIRREGNYLNWIKFFLRGVIETSKNSSQIILKLKDLRSKNIKLIGEKDIWLLDYIEKHPLLDVTLASKEFDKSDSISRFVELGILYISDKSRCYLYKDYIKILDFE